MSRRDEIIQQNIAFMYGRDDSLTKYDPDKRVLVKSKPKFVSTDITSLTGDFAQLAPDHMCPVCLPSEQIPYPSFLHGLQASKCDNTATRELIRQTPDIRDVKRIASNARPDWKKECISIGELLLRDKFVRNKDARNVLLKTKGNKIVYVNTFGEHFWGSGADGKGLNHLGTLLEKIRGDIENGEDLEKWFQGMLNVHASDAVNISFQVKKGDIVLQEDGKTFQKHSKIFIGRSDECEVVAAHPSISQTHAVVVADKKLGGVLVDLGSKAGTWVDRNPTAPFTFTPLTSSSEVRFGLSGRTYSFTVDPRAAALRQSVLYDRISNPSAVTTHEEDNERTAFVRGIPSTCTDGEITAVFEQCGKIQRIKIPRDGASGECKGIAFVTFETLSGLMQAIARDNDFLLGASIRVKRNVPKDKQPDPHRQSSQSQSQPQPRTSQVPSKLAEMERGGGGQGRRGEGLTFPARSMSNERPMPVAAASDSRRGGDTREGGPGGRRGSSRERDMGSVTGRGQERMRERGGRSASPQSSKGGRLSSRSSPSTSDSDSSSSSRSRDRSRGRRAHRESNGETEKMETKKRRRDSSPSSTSDDDDRGRPRAPRGIRNTRPADDRGRGDSRTRTNRNRDRSKDRGAEEARGGISREANLNLEERGGRHRSPARSGARAPSPSPSPSPPRRQGRTRHRSNS